MPIRSDRSPRSETTTSARTWSLTRVFESTPRERLLHLDRWDRQLWTIASLIMLTLAIALVALHFLRRDPQRAEEGDFAVQIGLGLISLVGLASAYFIIKRSEIRRLQAELGEEQAQSRELQGRLGEVANLIRAARALDVPPRTGELLPRVGEEFTRLVRSDRTLVVLRDGGKLKLTHLCGGEDHEFAPQIGDELPLDLRHRLSRREPVLAGDPSEVAERFGEGPWTEGVGSMISCPLRAPSKVFGFVLVQRMALPAGEPFGDYHAKLSWVLGGFASYVLTVARAQGSLRATNRNLRESMEKVQRAQARLIEVEKLTAVGEMVSGVAHELNNPLTAMVGYTQLLATFTPEQISANHHILNEIQGEAVRCSSIVQNLASFASTAPAGEPHESVRSVVDSTLAVRAYELRHAGVQVDVEVPDSLPRPSLDRDEMQQLVLNLVRNAISALRKRTKPCIVIRGWSDDQRIFLSVADNGCGIPRENLGSIFEPFFSTRPRKEGIGLGLHTCVTVLARHGGTIAVESEVGAGSTFTAQFPAEQELHARQQLPLHA